jgi:hypothetical protein
MESARRVAAFAVAIFGRPVGGGWRFSRVAPDRGVHFGHHPHAQRWVLSTMWPIATLTSTSNERPIAR